ncbi:chitooligosaccharidolytic beta-N-acetylglucosaminidase [Anopheles maculipalpis]|uniref:chitooligosaccharidolytic beta-N-acetylglucosaminidase n=1 Tax=Anopheles maculipalpis TaxID=1496333 RepID=UPI0021592783|nr:chitooligosaccharidolytic beta-N-acetylglucosaminidase [Anopheles maculipalpis]
MVCTDEQQCVKEFSYINGTSESHVFPTLNNCRLLCGKFGPLWPHPTGRVHLGKKTTAINPTTIKFEQYTNNQTAEAIKFLEEVENYFLLNLRRDYRIQMLYSDSTPMSLIVKMHASSYSKTNIEWSTDESYKLKVSIENITNVVAVIEAATVFGVRHGCETLLQLFTVVNEANFTSSLQMLSDAVITDQPAYAHRGLLIDTARNYIPINCLKRQLDAMAASKMNVLHWHVTDTQSFPIQLNRVPEMVSYGAYDSNQIYTSSDVRKLIRYAKYRGIRVILELDAPAHAGNGWQWGPEKGLGNLAVCINQKPWRKFCIEPPCGQLNPVNPNLYAVLQDIYYDLAFINKDEQILHMGGDEVFFGCWNATDEIVSYLVDHGMGRNETDFLMLWNEFQNNALRLWDNALYLVNTNRSSTTTSGKSKRTSPVILWSSHLTDPSVIVQFLSSDRYVIQTWVPSTNNMPQQLQKLGYKLIISTKDAWYLDHGFWGVTTYYNWKKVYENQLPKGNGILGGEVCVWTEYIDAHSLDGRTWPRAAAAAERLWSNPSTKALEAESRFFRHRERLISRGTQPEAIAPQWCQQNEGQCH